MRYILVEELESERKISDKISLPDFFFMIGYFVLSLAFSDLVHPKLTILYYAYNFFVSIILTRPSKNNPGKRIYESIFFILIKNRNVYKPISDESEGEEKDAL